jgi:gas vesicle protein
MTALAFLIGIMIGAAIGFQIGATPPPDGGSARAADDRDDRP